MITILDSYDDCSIVLSLREGQATWLNSWVVLCCSAERIILEK